MKRILFFVVSAFFATTGFCSNISEQVASVFKNNDTQIEQKQNQPLILQKVSDFVKTKMTSHYSHRSHYSHYSHRSHYSHYSSR